MATPRQLPSGHWRVQINVGKDKNGKYITESHTFLTQEEAQLFAASRKNVKAATQEYESLYNSLVSSRIKSAKGRKSNALPSEKIKKSIRANITKDIKKELAKIDGMDGKEFEEYCASLFKLSGYFYGGHVDITPYHNDFGADLIITCFGGFKVAVQCKRVSSAVRLEAVQEVIASKAQYGTHAACVITNRYFTPNTMELAENAGVTLIDRHGLIRLIEMKNKAMERIKNQWFAFIDDLYADKEDKEE